MFGSLEACGPLKATAASADAGGAANDFCPGLESEYNGCAMNDLPDLYTKLAEWWPLLSSPADYAQEAAAHWRAIVKHARRPVQTMLELGCGGGNNASHLKHWCRMTLTDLSPEMLEVSRRLNPECEHICGDMRTLRLNRHFDAVFIHDAIMYIRTREDLAAVMRTAFEHCHAGGVALLLPDHVRETFKPGDDEGGHDGAGRSFRYFEHAEDPDPDDDEYLVKMRYVLREGNGPARTIHDLHHCGLFDRASWISLLGQAGLAPLEITCEDGSDRLAFVGVRP